MSPRLAPALRNRLSVLAEGPRRYVDTRHLRRLLKLGLITCLPAGKHFHCAITDAGREELERALGTASSG